MTRICEQIGKAAVAVNVPLTAESPPIETIELPAPCILILGATEFIGRELTRQLIGSGHRVRALVRNPGKLAADLRDSRVDCVRGDLNDGAALRNAMAGIDCVYHLARANVKSWADYQRYEIGVTRAIAEAALSAGVKRFHLHWHHRFLLCRISGWHHYRANSYRPGNRQAQPLCPGESRL